eukprot:164567_1
MSNPQQTGGVERLMPPGGGPGEMFGNWKQRTPALSRLIPYFAIFSVIGSMFLYPYTCLCVSQVFDNYQVHRLLTTMFFDMGFLNALLTSIFLYLVVVRVEKEKGSVFTLHALLIMALLTNVLFLFLGGFFAYNPLTGGQVGISSFYCSFGMFPTFFALVVLECSFRPTEHRRVMCFPWTIPTKYMPFLLLLVCELLTFGNWRLDIVCGVIVGHIFSYWVLPLQLSAERMRNYENARALRWLAVRPNFVGVDPAGAPLPGPWSSPPFNSGGGNASGGFQQIPFSTGSGSSALNIAGPNPFTGRGYSLQDTGLSSSPSTGSPANPATEGHAAHAAAGPHPLAERYAEEQRRLKTQQEAAVSVHAVEVTGIKTNNINEETLIDIPEVVPSAPPASNSLSESQITRMMALGYTRADAVPALSHSGGDISGAVAFLQDK